MKKTIQIRVSRALGLLAAALAMTILPAAQAEPSYPSRPITLLVPVPTGSDTDTVARLLAEPLARELQQSVVVLNKAGAGGQVGMQAIASAKPDGYTIALTYQAAVALIPHLRAQAPYDPERDFTPVGRIATTGNAMLVAANSPYKSLNELVAAAKARPGKLSYGSWGSGSGGHLNGEALKAGAGVDILHVPYKSPAESVLALIAGDIDMVFVGYGIAATQARGGKVRVLATPATERSPLFSDAPTLREAGIPFAMDGWFGIVTPAGTPTSIVKQLHQALIAAADAPGFRERLLTLGMTVAPTSPDRFGEIIRSDYIAWGQIVKQTGVPKN